MTAVAQDLRHLIGGEWSGGGGDGVSVNPAHPSRVNAVFPTAGCTDVDQAVEAARSAQPAWARTPPPIRCEVLTRAAGLLEDRADAIAAELTTDEGKPLADAFGEVGRAVATLRFHASQGWMPTGERYAGADPEEEVWTSEVPVGTIGIVTPFNFPLVVSLVKLAPALAHGNTVVWKPSELAPMPALTLATVLAEAGLPPGVLNVVLGDGSVGELVSRHGDVDAVSFTGGPNAGRRVVADVAARGGRVQVEMGGHNPAIVLVDADLPAAARLIIEGAMREAGQKCTSTRRVIVEEACREQLERLLVTAAQALTLGDGLTPGTDIGPLVSSDALDRVADAVDEAVEQGASILTGGTRQDESNLDHGYFYPPTVLGDVRPEMTIATHEVFGPVLSVISADSETRALEIANGTPYGLTGSVFTQRESAKRRFIRDLDVGVVRINRQTTGNNPNVPFRGSRGSGSTLAPAEQGYEAKRFYTRTKTIYARP